jgi:hypothetical protein
MNLFRRGRKSRSLGDGLRAVAAELRRIVSLEIELRKARIVRALRSVALVAAALLAAAILLFLAGAAALVAIGLALAIVVPGWAAALVVSGLLGVLAFGAAVSVAVVKNATGRKGAAGDGRPSRSPTEIEAELLDAHYRLDAEIEALTRRGDRPSRSAAVANGGPDGRSRRHVHRG